MPPAAKKKPAAKKTPAARIPLANLEELATIWSKDARIPTVESRKAWCAARNLDYGQVNRQFWWKKSAKMKANKENVKGPRGGCYALPVGTPPVTVVKQEEEEEDTRLGAETDAPVKIELPDLLLPPSSPLIPSSDTLCPSSPPFVLKKSPSQEPIGLEDIPMPSAKRVRKKGPARKRLGKKPAIDNALAIKKESTVVQDTSHNEEKHAADPEKPAPVKRKPVAKKSAPARKRVRFDSPCPPLSLDDPTSHFCDGSCDLCSLPLPDECMTDIDTTRLEALYPWYFQPTYGPVFNTMPPDIPKALWSLSAIAYESLI
ncbi:hypothetical protein BDZ89DRAFT_1133318 [Hymenopellis radicata]|nr:hypothetical protein BDZ89DRAFT_1133318 [Hymenopellis radicata]